MNTEDQMVNACETGNLEELKILIEKGGDIHTTLTDYYYTGAKTNLLTIASMNNRINIVEFLIDNKLDIVSDFPILSIACNYYYCELFYFLINKIPDIDVNVEHIDGRRTPLFYARDLKIYKVLLDLGANPYHKDNYGKTFNSYVLPLFKKDKKELLEYIDTLNFGVKPAKGS
jgi:ankyrin repeat protein